MVERARVTDVVNGLFPLFMAQPQHLPQEWRNDVDAAKDEMALARLVADYVSGMTDRYAVEFYSRLKESGASIFKPI